MKILVDVKGGLNMNFEEAIHTISGVVDMYYEEFCNSDEGIEEYKEIAKAESALYLLIKELKNKGITNLKDLKNTEKVNFIVINLN
jgi:hypothetical protein